MFSRTTAGFGAASVIFGDLASFFARFITNRITNRAFFEFFLLLYMLAEFDTVQKISKTQKGAYIFVKKWFLGKYKEVFDAWQEEQDAKQRAGKEAHLLYTV